MQDTSWVPLFPDQASSFAWQVDYLYFYLVGISVFFTIIIVAGIFVFAVITSYSIHYTKLYDILVIGSPNSSNSNRLRELGEHCGIDSYLIDSASDINPAWLKDVNAIGITAGASAPEVLVEEVVTYLKTYGSAEVEDLTVIVITSYSIHYTKLYDGVSLRSFDGRRDDSERPGRDLFGGRGRGQIPLPGSRRITSYNVCYTKLLR